MKLWIKSLFFSVGLFMVAAMFWLPQKAVAIYQAGNLMDDYIFLAKDTMNTTDIQNFLNGKGGGIRNFSENGLSAAQIIYNKAQAYGLNPRAIMATLQKEQSLITDPSPSQQQYDCAMGYNSCSGYVGFTTQVDNGTWQLRFNYERASGNNSWWNPSISYACANPTSLYSTGLFPGRTVTFANPGGSARTITLANATTASLYCYTPYVGPYSETGYSGSYNFVTSYESWWGPSTGEGYTLDIADNGDLRQWVLMKDKRYYVPSADVKTAWGLPNQPTTMSASYLGSFPDGPNLTRLMRPTGTQDVYFVDSGKAYKVVNPSMLNGWGFNSASIDDVSIGLSQLPTNQGNLSYEVNHVSNKTDIYMVDGGQNRRYGNGNILQAWEGDDAGYHITTLSDAYFTAMGTGTDINSVKITNGVSGSQEYIVAAQQKLPESSTVAQLYPSLAQTVTQATIDRLVPSAAASQFVKCDSANPICTDSTTIYLVDGGTKHAVGSPNLVRAYGIGASPPVNVVTQGNLNLIPTSASSVNSFEADVSGQLYLMDGRAITVPASLDSAYRTTGNVYSASSALISLLPNGGTATNYLRASTAPDVSLIDATSLRHISDQTALNLWSNNGAEGVTVVSNYVLGQFTTGGAIGVYVKDGAGNEYVMAAGQNHHISPSVKTNWNLVNPPALVTATLSRFAAGVDLPNSLQNSGQYYLVHEGTGFMTVDPNIADVWGVRNATSLDSGVVNELLSLKTMTRLAIDKNGQSQFAVDNGTLYHLSPAQVVNLGAPPVSQMMTVDSASLPSGGDWTTIVVKDAANVVYVIDGGSKRPLPVGTIRNFWTNSDSLPELQMTNGFLNLLPTGIQIERAIKGSGPNIYAAQNETKRWIQSWNTYQTSYAPYASVSDALLNVLPDGTPIP